MFLCDYTVSFLRLRSRTAKGHGNLYFFQIFNWSIGCFVAGYVFHERLHKALGMLRRKYDAGLYFAFGCSGHDVHKVYHEFCMGVRNNGKICISTFSHFFGNFYIDLVLRLVCIVHKTKIGKLVHGAALNKKTAPLEAVFKDYQLYLLFHIFVDECAGTTGAIDQLEVDAECCS